MMRRWGLLAIVLLLVPAALACQQERAVAHEVTDDDLRAMVLKAQDLPDGFTLMEEKLTDNEEFARDFKDVDSIRGKVDGWGRGAGFENTLSSLSAPEKIRRPAFIGSSAERFSDVEHAHQAWDGQQGLVPQAKTDYSGLTSVKGPKLGDQSTSVRMYATDENGLELVVYWVYFRTGNVIASVSTAAPKHRDDRGEHAFRLAKLVNERVEARLK